MYIKYINNITAITASTKIPFFSFYTREPALVMERLGIKWFMR